MAKLNLNVPFVDFKGNPIRENGKEVIIAEKVGELLFGMGKGFEQKDFKQAWEIVRKLTDNPAEVELEAEDVMFLKRTMAQALIVGCYGQLYDILERKN